MSSSSVKARIEGALSIYNKYREPEVVAELLRIEAGGRRFLVRFAGTFCRTCGFYDYFEDFVYDLLDEGKIRATIVDVKEAWDTENFDVTYQIENPDPEYMSRLRRKRVSLKSQE